MGVQFSQLFLLPFYFITSFCSLLDNYDNVHLKVWGYLFLLVYHITPHMLHMITLRMKISGGFMDNDFA